MPLIRWVLVQMIGFISTWLHTNSQLHLHTAYRQYSAISHLHHLQTTIARALGFSLSTSHLLSMALNTETTTVSHSEYYAKIRPSNHTSILHKLTSCFLLCSWSQFALLFACFCRDYLSLVTKTVTAFTSHL
jgi:hypothetical protein